MSSSCNATESERCIMCSAQSVLLCAGLESRVLHFVVQPALQMGGDDPAQQAALQLQVSAFIRLGIRPLKLVCRYL